MSKFFSLAYLTLPNTHPVDQIEIAAQCGYEGVGLRTISQHLPGEPDYALANGRMFQMVRAALERTGVRLMDIELARVADGVDVMSYEKEFALGAELGAKYAIASVWSADRDFSRVQFGEDVRSGGQIRHEAQSGVRPLLKHPRPDRSPGLDGPDGPAQCAGAGGHSARPPGEGHPRTAAGGSGGAIRLRPPVRRSGLHPAGGPPGHGGVARGGRLYVGEGGIDLAGMLKNIPIPLLFHRAAQRGGGGDPGQAGARQTLPGDRQNLLRGAQI